MSPIDLALLGPFRARSSSGAPLGLPTRKTQALLAYLALRPGRICARDKLAALLWGDAGEKQARQSLRQSLSAIRKMVRRGPGLRDEGDTIELIPAAVRVDVLRFERLVARGTAEALAEAASLYGGDLLEGFAVKEEPFESWLRDERQRLRELALNALTRLVVSQEKRGTLDQAIQVAIRLLALDPSQEAVHRRLMRMYARQGRRGAALRQYQVCVDALRRELGTEPEEQTKQLYRELLQRRPDQTERRVGPRAERRSQRGLSSLADRGEVPLLGRGPELGRLRRDLEHARRGRGRFVVVLGEAGIGKSRLADELAGEAVRRGFRPIVGRCYQSEQILPFAPWISALRAARIATDAEMRASLGSTWRAELARLLPETFEAGSGSPAGPHDFVRLFEAVYQLVAFLSTRDPLLIVVEDLHWADEMSLRLLAFLAHRIAGSRVLMVTTAREEEIDEAPALARTLEEMGREPSVERLPLGPLSQADIFGLVRSLERSGRDLTRLGDRIWRVSGGNPFIAVEMIRTVQEGAQTMGSPVLALPRQVRDLIAGRLRRLSPRARHLVALGAVIGREFEFALLQRAARTTPARTAEALEELVRRRVMHGVGQHFDFAHDRIREVAYEQLLVPRRSLLHGQVAGALEALYRADLEAHYGAIGVHYQEAEVWDRAFAYLRRAGAHAFARSASREATGFFERALNALAHLPKTHTMLEHGIDLRFALRNSLYQLGALPRVLTYLQQAERLTHMLDDPRRLAWLALHMGAHLWLLGDPREAGGFTQRAQVIGESIGDRSLDIWARYYLGLTSFASGRYRQAEDLLRAVVEQLGGDLGRDRLGMAGFPSVIARAWLARTLAEQGDFSEGLEHGHDAVRIGEELDHPYSSIFACWHLAHLQSVRGDPCSAIEWAERGLSLARKWEVALLVPLVTWPLGYARALSGDARAGLSLLDQALTSIRSMGMGAFLPIATLHRGEALAHAGQFHEALESAEGALALAGEHGQPGVEAGALRLRAEVASARLGPSDVKTAEADYQRALALAEERGMRPLVARCHAGLGALYERARRHQEAVEHLGHANTMLKGMAMEFWMAGPAR